MAKIMHTDTVHAGSVRDPPDFFIEKTSGKIKNPFIWRDFIKAVDLAHGLLINKLRDCYLPFTFRSLGR